MDSITHTVLGACVGEAMAGKKLGKKAMLIGAIANNLPDIDVVTSMWMSQPDGLLAHRGFTHSFLFVILLAPLTGWLMKKFFSNTDFSGIQWSMLIGVNLLLHLIIDSFTVYGTGLLEPFSHARISFDIIFVADPFYTIALLIAAIVLLFLSKSSLKRKGWAVAGLVISSCYVFYTIYHKVRVEQVMKKSLMEEKLVYHDYISTPTPFNNFLWYLLASNDSGYNIGYYSVFDQSDDVHFRYISRNDSLLGPLKENYEVKKLIRFSNGFYHIGKTDDTLIFYDLRFGQVGGWGSGDAPFVFQYKLADNIHHPMAIQSGRKQASAGKALKHMIERIKGR